MSVVWKPSHCPRCGHDIRMRDNVPVLGWLLLRGKCRDCGAPIAARYAIVEAIMGLAFGWLAWTELLSGGGNLPGGPLVSPAGAANVVINPDWAMIGLFVYHAILMSLLIAIALIDADNGRAPWSFAILAVVLVAIASTHHQTWYPEHHWMGVIWLPNAAMVALAGALSGAIPFIIAALSEWRGRGPRLARFRNLAMAMGMIGGFLGVSAVDRILLGWVLILIGGIAMPPRLRIVTLIGSAWLLVLIHIAYWDRIATAFNVQAVVEVIRKVAT
jgi:prepilin signal peptidase PulO-like enzyme (type II secretory pathway)